MKQPVYPLIVLAFAAGLAVNHWPDVPANLPEEAEAGNLTLPAFDFSGTASVIDGDTIEIHGKRIRLFGIDAPESDQTCTKDNRPYRCGQHAALALADKIDRRPVYCEQRDTDRHGRAVATCRQAGIDLGQWLVKQGHAIAYRKYSVAYVSDEDAAKASGMGIWSGEFVSPEEFRHRRKWSAKLVSGQRLQADQGSAPALTEGDFSIRSKDPAAPPKQTQQNLIASPSPTPPDQPASLPMNLTSAASPPASATSAAGSDQQIAKFLIRRSLASYTGSCACPEHTDRAGRRCGKRSAYLRPGGAVPLCYEHDVTPAMMAKYREAHAN
jgi:endonuclease YncB( thermonuclease family)